MGYKDVWATRTPELPIQLYVRRRAGNSRLLPFSPDLAIDPKHVHASSPNQYSAETLEEVFEWIKLTLEKYPKGKFEFSIIS